MQGAFTFAVGPNAGPAPQFTIPHIAGTATSTPLVIAKWLAFLTVMAAIGLFVLRIAIARPLVRRVVGHEPARAHGRVRASPSALGLVAIPAYLEEAIAIDSLRSFCDVGALVPLWRLTAFGRGYVDLELCFALFVVAAAVAIWVDRPERERRSVAALLAAQRRARWRPRPCSCCPGRSATPARRRRAASPCSLDWLHLVSGSIWIGGLVGLLVRLAQPSGREARRRPRRLRAALLERRLRLGAGAARHRRRRAVLHLPVLDALWLTSYGKVILIKAGILARRDAARLGQPAADEAAASTRRRGERAVGAAVAPTVVGRGCCS